MIRFLTALPAAAFLCAILTTAPMAEGRTADLVVIFKGERLMELYGGGDLMNRYRVSLGWAPAGAKRRAGDGRTPEGLYTISRHNPNSNYHLSLGISYPGPEDVGNAILLGVPAGGQVMIHGFPNRVRGEHPDPGDWTDGCIAVNNHEIEQIYAAVPDGTPVMILP